MLSEFEAVPQQERDLCYLAGVTISRDLLRADMIDTDDYAALETAYAEKYKPLFRYENPCLLHDICITHQHRDVSTKCEREREE